MGLEGQSLPVLDEQSGSVYPPVGAQKAAVDEGPPMRSTFPPAGGPGAGKRLVAPARLHFARHPPLTTQRLDMEVIGALVSRQ
jgi:hypothetical protein